MPFDQPSTGSPWDGFSKKAGGGITAGECPRRMLAVAGAFRDA